METFPIQMETFPNLLKTNVDQIMFCRGTLWEPLETSGGPQGLYGDSATV